MSKEEIVGRIISDAEEEAKAIVEAAEEKAAQTVAKAESKAEEARKDAEAEGAHKGKGSFDGKAATARLDGAKIMLGAKRDVIDEVYARALRSLVKLDKESALALAEGLLKSYAEEGDCVTFAKNYPYAEEVALLPVVEEKHLRVSLERVELDGGFILVGRRSDKNLSYGALLSADREERQAEIASQIF